MKKVFFVSLVLFLGLIPANGIGQISHSVSFSKSEGQVLPISGEDAVKYQQLSFIGAHSTLDVGKPDLPEKYIRLIIPSNQDVESVSLSNLNQQQLEGIYLIYPVQQQVPIGDGFSKPAFSKPDPSVYSLDNIFPKNAASFVRDGFFDGANHIVIIAVYPYQYQPKSGKLFFNSSFKINIKLTSGKSKNIQVFNRNESQQNVYTSILKQNVDNPEMINAFQVTPRLGKTEGTLVVNQLPVYDYVVITSNALKPYFNELISWKIRKGLQAGVVTTEEIYSQYTGDLISEINDDAGKIRQYLSDAYQNGTVWVVLGGDHSIIPVRYGAGYDGGQWTDDSEYKIPADLYFSDFNGDWDVSDDDDTKRFGEPGNDDVDYNPEVFVGRVPCTNSTDITNWVGKLIQYETYPGNGNLAFLSKSFWIHGPDLNVNLDLIKNHYPTFFNHTIWDQSSLHTGTEIISEMSNQYGLINWYAHGNPAFFQVKPASPGKYLWNFDTNCRFDGSECAEAGSGLNNMTNNNYYPVVYSISCDIAAFDDFKNTEYIGRSLVEGFTTIYPNSGGPALIGNTRLGYYSSGSLYGSADLQIVFNELLKNGTEDPESGESYLHLGVAEGVSKQSFYWHYLILSGNLFGCPETKIWTASPNSFSSATVTDNGTSLTVNAGVSGCNISVTSGNDGTTYNQKASNVTSYSFSTSVRPLYITITKTNYLPYIAVTGGTFSTSERWFGNMRVLGNVTIASGSTLTVDKNTFLNFSNNTTLTINGALNAIGTSSNKITIDRIGSSGNWSGLVFNSGSSGSIEYCEIKNATTGITCNSVLPSIRYNTISNNSTGISVSNVSTPTNEISYNTIQNNTSRGIYLSYASPKIYNNTISNNASYGIYCTNSSPFLAGNYVSGHSSTGLKFTYYSSAKLVPWNSYGAYWGAGHNTITGNTGTGISADYYSNLYLGSSPYGGYNSMFSNSSYELQAAYNCTITAELNWWGANPPSAGEFLIYQSTVDYTPYLTSNPYSPGQYLVPVEGKESGIAKPDPEISDLEAGYRLQLAGKFDEAVALYKNLIETNSADKNAATALLRMRECYKWMGKGSFSTYLENLTAQKSDATDELGLVFRDMNTQILVENNKFIEAIANLDNQAEAFKTNAYAHKYSLFNAGFIYLRYLNDVEKAKAKFDELAASYPKDDLVSESNYLLGESVDSNSPQQALANPTDEKSAVPTQYGLSQNYPNPFNPSTTLRYQTPEKGLVQLKVYDLMGREVAVLVNTVKEAGYYELVFDANSVNGGLSSGVYLFKIQVNSFTATQKMVLLK